MTTHKITLAELVAAAKPKTRKRLEAALKERATPVVTVAVIPVDASEEAFSAAYDAALAKLSKQEG